MKKKVLFSTIIAIAVLLGGWLGVDAISSSNKSSNEFVSEKAGANTPTNIQSERVKQSIDLEKTYDQNKDYKKENEKSKKKDLEKEVGKEKATTKKSTPEFITEEMTGEFMSTVELNMRKGPSTEFDIVGNLKPFQKAVASKKATLNESTWYKITVNGISGWSSSSYLKEYKRAAKPIKKAEKQTTQKKTEKQTTQKEKNTNKPKYKPNTIYFNGKAVPYKNAGPWKGQEVIDTTKYATTWGGETTFSGTDGKITHFGDHTPGNFEGIQNAKKFVVTDSEGTPFTYHTTKVYKIHADVSDDDNFGVGLNDGINHWDRLMSSGNKEGVIFQTCTLENPDINWVIEAE